MYVTLRWFTGCEFAEETVKKYSPRYWWLIDNEGAYEE